MGFYIEEARYAVRGTRCKMQDARYKFEFTIEGGRPGGMGREDRRLCDDTKSSVWRDYEVRFVDRWKRREACLMSIYAEGRVVLGTFRLR